MSASTEVPVGWDRLKIGECAAVKRGASPRPIEDAKWWGGEIGWVRISDVTSARKYLFKTRDYLSAAGVRQSVAIKVGEVVMSICATIGRSIITTIPVCIHDGFVWFDGLGDHIDREYFYYYLASKEAEFSGHRQMGTQGNLNTTIVSNVDLLIPTSKPEQTKIAEILSTVDRAIEQTESLIAKQQRLKTGLMQDLLTRGIDQHGNLRSEQTHKFKDSPLGRIPVEWEVKQIKDIGLVVTGNTPSESAFADDYQSVPFITPADVGVTTAIHRTTRSFGKTSATSVRMIPAGSICVVCIGSTIGKIGVTICEAATNQQINSVIPHEPKVSEFLLHSMLLNLPHQLRKEAGLQAVPIVNKSTFERLSIAQPRESKEAIEIQRQISSPAAIAESGTRTLVKLRALKTALMQDLLTGRKRVTELLNDEEASA